MLRKLLWIIITVSPFSIFTIKTMDNNHSVSFIYYPTGHDFPIGHAEVEIDGTSWNLLGDDHYGSRPLTSLIDKSTKDGFPFLRYVFDANPTQIEEMKKHLSKNKFSINCSRAALYPLSKAKLCSVPLPVNASPLMTAIYLKMGKELKLNAVKTIEYYGNPSLKDSIAKMMLGSFVEALPIAGGLALYTIYHFDIAI